MDIFWKSIEKEIEDNFGWGNPKDWKEKTIKLFLASMDEKLLSLCEKNHQIAQKCGVPFIKGRYAIELLKIITPSTFRRIFQYQQSNGQAVTKNQFAIYFDALSAEDYINTKNIKPTKKISSKKEFKLRWKKSSLVMSSVVIFLVIQSLVANKSNNTNSPTTNPSNPIQNSVLETKGTNSPIIIGRDINVNYLQEDTLKMDSL